MKLLNLKRSLLFTRTLIIACVVLIPAAWAEYPEKPINLIVGFKAGGTSDTVARFLARSLQTQLGQPVLVMNKPGGGGTLAATTVKKSAPDGYNIAVITNTAYTFMPYFMAMQKKAPYNWDDFTHLATVGEIQLAFVGPPAVKNWQDLLALGRQKGGLSVASLSPTIGLITRLIAKKEGISIKSVPFKGGSESMPALLGGHTDFAVSGGIHIKYTRAGKMNTLAAFSGDGLAAEPEVPTLRQLGYDIDFGVSLTVSLPKGTPPEIVQKLQQALSRAVQEKEYIDLMAKLVIPVNFRDAAQTTQYMKNQSVYNKQLFDFLKQ